ncbi:MAG: TetR/AcrR family transcriptional regulator [Clostridium sp.]|nr:TetR/AcrR family transcriptional regulator [Clostridium sp.]
MNREEREDRRVRKTKRSLKNCLVRLMKEKKLQDITVREISDMADINRGTFYLHYKDIYDLLDQIEGEFADQFDAILNHYTAKELSEKPSLLFGELYPFIHENADLITALMGTNGNLNFENRIKSIIRERALARWLEQNYSEEMDQVGAFLSYIVSGCIGLVQYWISTDFHETPEKMALLTEAFITRGIHVFEIPGADPGSLAVMKL